MVLSIIVAAAISASPLDAAHAAVLNVLRDQREGGGCETSELRAIAAKAEIQTLGRIGADRFVLALVTNPCICGAQNCPYYALRLGTGKPRALFTAYGIDAKLVARRSGLPDVVVAAHDSAAVIEETTYTFRNGTYTAAKTLSVRVGDGARKPSIVPVRFGANASSAALHGRVALGWPDAYEFSATRGQRLTVTLADARVPVTLTLFGRADGDIVKLRSGVPVTLPDSVTYQLHVEGIGAEDVSYALTLAVR